MSKRAFLGVRLEVQLKKELEDISGAEERSISQICEMLLRRGIEEYKKEGSKYLRRQVSAKQGKTSAG